LLDATLLGGFTALMAVVVAPCAVAVAVDGVVVKTAQGLNGALCSIRAW
jgi:hypothetical protein